MWLSQMERGCIPIRKGFQVRKGFRGKMGAIISFMSGTRGATTAEYALLLALVVVILIGTLSQLGEALNGKLQEIISSLNTAN